MTAAIDALLARARLLDEADTPYDHVRVPRAGTGPAVGRLAATGAALSAGTGFAPGVVHATVSPAGRAWKDGVARAAARDLRSLCEAVVTTAAVTSLSDFLTQALPKPPGARVLGCILQLSGAEDSARFWWQYAAGAGDTPATYCLYLHHLSLGEQGEATWWQQQAPCAARPARACDDPGGGPEPGFPLDHPPVRTDRSVPTTLRVLSRLKVSERPAELRARPAVVGAVMDYVASAVSYVDPDLELPLPHADFTDHIRVLTKRAAGAARSPSYRRPLAVRRRARSDRG
ncbi:hypothetical protein ABT390_10010 [Streptomyces aurantiacus]|uniref:Uncharacterized protein n=1 Tax=Streptomyces aurantiacus JA 4570 TaxID=1286094 RepID=S3ZND1_9ACTN|nr:hypothetical protein [Streptomyces aurantiacus]EPH44294.1 hypothetical protein STRAU_2734 [Streptomyces aurantiacus JA 4570]